MTRSIGLEQFYANFQNQVAITSSFTDQEWLATLITLCRLKPYDMMLGNYTKNIILHHHWIDEFGNSLHIGKDKSLTITLNDLSINRTKLVNSDLYGQLSLEKVASVSKSIYFLYGKDE